MLSRHTIGLLFVLATTWLLLSGHTKPLLLSLGAVSVLGVVLLAHRMGISDAEGAPLGLVPGLVTYLPWLLLEIARSNVAVTREILRPRPRLEPRLLRVRASQTTEVGRVLYANSITLTPGTVTVGVEGDELVVHALTVESARSLASGEMDRRARRAEGRTGR